MSKGPQRKGPRKKKRRVVAAPAPVASDARRRTVLIVGGISLAVLVVIVALVVVNSSSEPGPGEEPPRIAKVEYHGIQGGFTEEGFPYLGSLEADVVLMEFTDFYCSHCRDFNLDAEDSILSDYVATGQVRYVLHYYSSGSAPSLQVADAAMCAADQGLYFQFQRAFFEDPVTSRTGFMDRAGELGMDQDDFMACWDAGRHRSELMSHIQSARLMGVSSTPNFKINNQIVLGNDPNTIRQTIENELAAPTE